MTRVKKTGIKRHIGVDILGLPHAILLTTADVADRDGAVRMVSRCCGATDCLDLLRKIMADRGYAGEKFVETAKSVCGAEAEVVKRNGLHTFVVLPKRRIVERTFGWLDKCRKALEKLRAPSPQFPPDDFPSFIRLLLARYSNPTPDIVIQLKSKRQ